MVCLLCNCFWLRFLIFLVPLELDAIRVSSDTHEGVVTSSVPCDDIIVPVRGEILEVIVVESFRRVDLSVS